MTEKAKIEGKKPLKRNKENERRKTDMYGSKTPITFFRPAIKW